MHTTSQKTYGRAPDRYVGHSVAAHIDLTGGSGRAQGSGLPILSRYVLDGLGLKQDEDFKAVYLSSAPATSDDGRGRPGRRAVGRRHRLARFAAVASSASGARFIAPSAEEIARIRTKHAFLKPLTVPGGSYPRQTEPIAALGSWSFVLTRQDLPDDIARRLARTLHGAEATFCKKLPQACETTVGTRWRQRRNRS